MRITLLAYGTRGDVQPVLALARELVGAGHTVRMAAGSDFRDRIAELQRLALKLNWIVLDEVVRV